MLVDHGPTLALVSLRVVRMWATGNLAGFARVKDSLGEILHLPAKHGLLGLSNALQGRDRLRPVSMTANWLLKKSAPYHPFSSEGSHPEEGWPLN